MASGPEWYDATFFERIIGKRKNLGKKTRR